MKKGEEVKMIDIETFRTYLENKEFDKALLLVDFILDDESPYYFNQKNLILFMFSFLEDFEKEDLIKSYTTISFDVLLNSNDQFRNTIITYILGQQFSKALRLLKTLMEKEQAKYGKIERFDFVLYELLHALLRKRDAEENLIKKLYQEGKYEEVIIYLDEEAKRHRLSRTNSIIRELLNVYINILKTNEVPMMLPKCNNIDNFNAYFEVHDYYNAYLMICKNAAKAKKDFPKDIYLDLLNKINTLISKINRENKREESPTLKLCSSFKAQDFAKEIKESIPQIASDGLIILEPVERIINKKRKEVINNFKGLSTLKIGDNLESLAVIQSLTSDAKMPVELMASLRNCYSKGDYQRAILLGRKIVDFGRPTVKDLLMLAMSYLKLGENTLGTLYLKLAINLGKRLDKDAKDKGWNYWDLENILDHFEGETKVNSLDERMRRI